MFARIIITSCQMTSTRAKSWDSDLSIEVSVPPPLPPLSQMQTKGSPVGGNHTTIDLLATTNRTMTLYRLYNNCNGDESSLM